MNWHGVRVVDVRQPMLSNMNVMRSQSSRIVADVELAHRLGQVGERVNSFLEENQRLDA